MFSNIHCFGFDLFFEPNRLIKKKNVSRKKAITSAWVETRLLFKI